MMKIGKYLGIAAAFFAFAAATNAIESGARIPCEDDGPIFGGMHNYPQGFITVNGKKNCMLMRIAGCSADKGNLYLYASDGVCKDGSPRYRKIGRIKHDEALKKKLRGTRVSIGGVRVFNLPNGKICGFIAAGPELLRVELNPDTLTFSMVAAPLKMPPMQTFVFRPDGKVRLYGIASKLVRKARPTGGWWSETQQYFDGAGISRERVSYEHIVMSELPDFLSDELSVPVRVSETELEMRGAYDIASFVDAEGRMRLFVSTIFGTIVHYFINDDGSLSKRSYCKQGDILLRHPAWGATCRIRRSRDGNPDIVSGGECAPYFFKFKKYDTDGSPIYEKPVLLKGGGNDLYSGSLPVVQAVDFDGDGLSDLVAGNGQGEIWFFKNVGKAGYPKFVAGKPLTIEGEKFVEKAGYWGLQGFFESQWGYNSPMLFDWNGDGLLDILSGDSTQRFGVYFNIGTKEKPDFKHRQNLFCDGLELMGTWRTRPAVAKMGNRVAYVFSDEDDHAHIYWRIDDRNVEDGGKLRMKNGSPIAQNNVVASGSGRSKYMLRDVDGDGRTDLLIGTPLNGCIPDEKTGLPVTARSPENIGAGGDKAKVRIGAAVIWLKNVGTDEKPVFDAARMMRFKGDLAKGELTQFGAHECAADMADFGAGLKGIVVSAEEGELYFFKLDDLIWQTRDEIMAKPFKEQNPSPLRPKPFDD